MNHPLCASRPRISLPTVLLWCALSWHAAAQLPARLVDFREPRSGFVTLAEGIELPLEDGGYTLLLPSADTIKALIVMFHPGRDTAHAGFEQRLYVPAVKRGVAVMYLTTGNRFEFLFDEAQCRQLDEYLHKAIVENGLPADAMVFAGMSLAGTRAARFAQWCLAGHSAYGIEPAGLVLCDAPLDMIRMWRESKRALAINPVGVVQGEARWVTSVLERNLHGTPEGNPAAWYDYSPYSHDKLDGGKAALLKHLPLRAYTEPDIQWWLANRHRDYYSINAIDAAALVNLLQIMGNDDAELITTTGKGYHPDGSRHPHSWSIVDDADLVDWVLRLAARRHQ